MGRISERLILAMLGLFLLSYVGFQAYRYYATPVRVETVFHYEVYRSVDVTGAVVRRETVIQHPGAGVRSYAIEDGQRVSVGQTVVEFYESEAFDHQIKRMRELEQEIDMLTEAQNPAVSNFSNAEGLGRDIRGQLAQLTQMSGKGRYSGAETVRRSVTSLLSRRQVAIGREDGYNERISALREEYNAIGAVSETSSSNSATAPISGYFMREVDGLEYELVPDNALFNLDVAGYRELIGTAMRPLGNPDAVGKIVTDQDWYFIALVPKFDVQDIRPGWQVSMDFEGIDQTVSGTVHKMLHENVDDYAALIIRCNHVTGDLLRMRVPEAHIRFNRFSGLRVNTSDLRMVDGIQGVYVLVNRTVVFRRIDPIYEESGFVISRPLEDLNEQQREAEREQPYELVKRFDQVIVRGMDLYHGKTIE